MYPYLHTEDSPGNRDDFVSFPTLYGTINLEIMVFPCNRTAPLIQQVVIEKF